MTQSNVWLVTGASKGLGLATVRHVLAQGFRVAATSRNAKRLQAEVGAGEDVFLPLDVTLTDEASIALAISQTKEHFGSIDVLVNNAGYAILGAMEEISDADVRANFDINVFGVMNMMRAVLPVMRAQGRGHIINIASISGSLGMASTAIYSATKAAVILLSESVAVEVADFGISVTALCPGGFRTDFLDSSSVHHPEHAIPAYQGVHDAMERFAHLNGRQGGDPEKAAAVMVALSQMKSAPTRLYIGSDALQGIDYKLHDIAQSVETFRALGESTNFRR
ncbi:MULTISPECIES: SDR family oxidoreductase [Acetobacter]|uniref:NAD(P)-dependent dehydrogenase (Short-subunit alcohol dehydrogenase family) n=1 Tax=Acetobacter lovaniensis TaxID=104100 RepID=A0A841QJF6_9PROT|nr:SDR family oxidoreductase [Acetobacter lovaniensis]MBB6458546.1 NAD(P)-dependent dehydrogenase (short-subunit alcohol dehydrogenase family) [Acetobacter lovaniensis]MCI1795365.1 SDR family oxidoreductase [Acetobacter lovaniensis]MCP1240700.1 SDR family oxidoreductase [Acetobacter lovaniensis]NHN82747.1 SDR family NAD(P)-dependent oxidoreductase [Acetobacter lovaniensis]GBQ65230.1 dehydrogenase [Acetobacter lovaniensis NRIC 0474]